MTRPRLAGRHSQHSRPAAVCCLTRCRPESHRSACEAVDQRNQHSGSLLFEKLTPLGHTWQQTRGNSARASVETAVHNSSNCTQAHALITLRPI